MCLSVSRVLSDCSLPGVLSDFSVCSAQVTLVSSECLDPPVESLVYMGDSPNPVSGGFGLSGSYSAVMSLGDSLSPVSGSSCTILSLGDSPNPMSGSSCAVPSMEDGPSPMSGGSGLSTSSYMYQVRILRLYTYNHSNF